MPKPKITVSQAKRELTFRDILPVLAFLLVFLLGVAGLLIFTFHVIPF